MACPKLDDIAYGKSDKKKTKKDETRQVVGQSGETWAEQSLT
jgi:hypothetical protein